MQNSRFPSKYLNNPLIVILLILFPTLLIYYQCMHFDFLFLWDDSVYVTDNPYIQGFNWPNIKGIFTHFFVSNYAPVQMFSYILDYNQWGMDPLGYHLTNVLLHAFSSVFLFFLIRRITGRAAVALTASLIFTVHPVQVENVAWVSQRKSLLAMALFLPSFYFYLLYSERRQKRWYWGSCLLFGLSLLSKVSTITLPLFLFFYDLLQKKEEWKKSLLNKFPYFILSILMGLVTIYSQTEKSGLLSYGGPLGNFLTTIVVVKEYIQMLLFPVNLSAYHLFMHKNLSDPQVFLSLLIVGLVLFMGVHLFKRNAEIRFWVLWPVIALAPNLNIVPLAVTMADRYLYLPLIGLAVLVGYLFADFLKKSERDGGISWSGRLLLSLIVILFTLMSYQRTGVWKDGLSLWSDTIQKRPQGLPYNNLGNVYLALERIEEAQRAFSMSIQAEPAAYRPYQNLGIIYLQEKDLTKAEKYLMQALNRKPGNPDVLNVLAKVYAARDDLHRALRVIRQGLEILPDHSELLEGQFHILFQRGDLEESLEKYKKLVESNPEGYVNWVNYGTALAHLGKIDEAEKALKHAVKIDRNLPQAYRELAALSEGKGDYQGTAEYYEESLKSDQRNVQILHKLSFLYAEHFPEKAARAIDLSQKALGLSPDPPDIIDTLGWTFCMQGRFDQAINYFERSLIVYPEEPFLLYYLGLAYLYSGEHGQGSARLKELVRSHPNHTLSKKAKDILKQ